MPLAEKIACRILVVEDDQQARDALVLLLSRFGFQTDTAGSVAEGLERLHEQQCAILDLNLPDGHGTEILERIRAENRPVRVAVVSGTTDEQLWTETQKYEPELLLRKPFDINVLLEWLATAT